MGLLDEPGLERLIAAGCVKCGSAKLVFASYVDGLVQMVGAEPISRVAWVYDGEKFIDGVYEVSCAACKDVVFAAKVCPRCHAADGLARALGPPNRWPVPATCPSCDGEELLYIAFLPARVDYE